MKLGPRQERYVGNKYKAGDLETREAEGEGAVLVRDDGGDQKQRRSVRYVSADILAFYSFFIVA